MSTAGPGSGSSAAASARTLGLFRHSPLELSQPLTNLVGVPVWLKMDYMQPSGSFKDRGISHMCETLKRDGATKFISSSGGNAGHAVACAGRALGVDVTVFVPETTKPFMADKIRAQGAQVVVHGENWNAADALARETVEAEPTAQYIPPYDDPLLWEGHSSIVDEIVHDMPDEPFGAIVGSVGGGGLLCGVYQGLQRHALQDVLVIAAETEGAASFAKSFNSPDPLTAVRLPGIDTLATSLGALQVTDALLEFAQQQPTATAVCTDTEAVEACLRFASDHRVLVEPACGAGLAVAYSERLRPMLQALPSVVIEVCGGSGVNLALLEEWRKTTGASL